MSKRMHASSAGSFGSAGGGTELPPDLATLPLMDHATHAIQSGQRGGAGDGTAARSAAARGRVSYEIATAVRKLDEEIPVERGEVIELTPISFAAGDRSRGHKVLFYAGDSLDTNEDRTVFFVRPRTCRMLEALSVPYHVIDSRTQMPR